MLDLAAPLRQRGVVAVLELLGGGQAGLQRRRLQRGQKRPGDRGVDPGTTDTQVTRAAALDEVPGAGAVVAGGGLGRAVVVDRELAPTHPAGGQPLQQRAALARRAGARLVRPRADVAANPDLVGLVGIPIDEPAVMIDDQHLPFVLRQPMAAGAQLPIGVDAAVGAGAAEGVGARVGGMGEHGVHRMVGRRHPGDLLAAGDVAMPLQREPQPLIAQPQPHPAHRPAHREPLEDRRDHPGDGFVGVQADLSVGLAPHQPDRQRTAQLAAGGLGADAAVQAGTQDVQFGLRHGALHAQQHPIIEQPGMVDAVGVGDQRVGHPGQIQQPVPVGVVAGQPRNLQRQHDSHLTEPDLRGQLGEPGPARGAGPGHAQVLVDHPHPGARPAQLDRAADQVVLAGGGFPVTGQLGHGGLAHIHHRGATQLCSADLGFTHRRPPRCPSRRPPWRSRWPAT